MYKKLNEVKKNWSVPPRRNVHSPSDQADEVEFSSGCTILSLNPDTMSNLDLYNYISKTENIYKTLLCNDSFIYIYTRLKQVLQTLFFCDFILVYFDWCMLMISSYPTVAGFPSRLSWRGPRSRDLGSLPGREFPGLRHGGDARRRLDVPVLW